MTRCPLSRPKHRVSVSNNKQPKDYRHGMKGHSYKKLTNNDNVHIGRECTKCGKKILNPRGK